MRRDERKLCGASARGRKSPHVSFAVKAVFCAVLLLMCIAWGCGRESKKQTLEEGQYYTFYVNQAGTALVSRIYEPESADTEGIIAELLEQCQAVPEGSDGRRAIPANVVLAGPAHLEDRIVNIYFDTTYTLMDKMTELLCKAALAKTITQLEDVDYISIYVNDKPYTGGNGNGNGSGGNGEDPGKTGLPDAVGENGIGVTESAGSVSAEPILLSASDFIDNTGDATNQYSQADLVLYFANAEGNALVAEERSVVYPSSRSLERVVINQLIEGPQTEGNTATLPASLKVQDISLREGVCYVDFDSAFLEQPVNVTDAIELYSVVNSLTELDSITQVQITVNGSAGEVLRSNIPLSGKFEQDLSYVRQPEEETEPAGQ